MQQCKGCANFDDRLRRWKCIKSHTKRLLLLLLDMIALGFVGWHEYSCPGRINKYTRIRERHENYMPHINCRCSLIPWDTGMQHTGNVMPRDRCGECRRWLPIAGISCQGRCIMTSGFCLKERKVTQYQDSCHRKAEEE